MKWSFKDDGKRLFFVTLAAVIYSINMKTFVRAGNLYPGGITGMTVLIQRVFQTFFAIELPFSIVNLILNSVPIMIGFKFIGKKFTMYSCVMIVLSSILTDIIPIQPLTNDVLLVSIFGGLINGFMIGLCLMGRACSGGLDFVSIFISNKYNKDAWNYILVGNAIILLTAGFLFGWGQALYSIIFQFTSTQIVHIMDQKYKQHTLFIITDHPLDVYKTIQQLTNHGGTLFQGTGLYENENRSMVYSVVSSAEVKSVINGVKEADPKAFINVIKTDQVGGRFIIKKDD